MDGDDETFLSKLNSQLDFECTRSGKRRKLLSENKFERLIDFYDKFGFEEVVTYLRTIALSNFCSDQKRMLPSALPCGLALLWVRSIKASKTPSAKCAWVEIQRPRI